MYSSFAGCDIFCERFHKFIPKHKSYCAGDVSHHWNHCLHHLTSHNTVVAAVHGDCDCDDGDGDDGGCDPVVVVVVVVVVVAAAVVAAVVFVSVFVFVSVSRGPCEIRLPVLPAHTEFHLTVM